MALFQKTSIDRGYTFCYTSYMKTAISIDKELFEEADNFSRNAGLSRSGLYCTAIREYIQNHSGDLVTEKLNKYYESNNSGVDSDLKAATYRLLEGDDW